MSDCKKAMTVDEVILALQAISQAGHGGVDVFAATYCCQIEAGAVVFQKEPGWTAGNVVIEPIKAG